MPQHPPLPRPVRHHGLLRWFAGAALLLALATPGAAQVTVAAPAVIGATAQSVTGEALAADFAVAAGPKAQLHLILPAALTALDGGEDVPLRWTMADSGAQAPADTPILLPPGSISGFRMQATLPTTRRYAASLRVTEGAAAAQPVQTLGPYVFARAKVPLPDRFLPENVHHAETIWPWLPVSAAGANTKFLITVKGLNATDHPVPVDKPMVGALARNGAVEGTIDASHPVADVTVQADCPDSVPAGAFCTLMLDLPGLLMPGRYTLDASLTGTEGGVSTTRVTLDVRAPGWLAALVVAAGAILGAVVAHWREVDRPRALAELPLVMLADQFRRLAAAAHSPLVVALLRDRVALIEAGLRAGRLGVADPAPDGTALAADRDVLSRSDRVLARLDEAPPAQQTALAAKKLALLDTLGADPWVRDATAAALATLEAAWAARQNLVMQTTVTTEAAGGAAADLTLPVGSLLPGVEADVATFLRRITRMDLGTGLFIAGLIGLGGVAVLWVTDPTWGSGMDVVTAFAAGVATRLTLPMPGAKPFG